MKKVDLPWNSAAVFICEKCGKSIDGVKSSDKGIADDLKSYYRTELKKEDRHKDIRVMVSGCFNICEKGKQAAVLFKKNSNEAIAWTFDPEQEKDEILKNIRRQAGV